MARRKPPHWFQNRHELQKKPLEERCAAAAALISYGGTNLRSADFGRMSELVFEVAASRLPDAQTNEFWPHFHREFERLSGTSCARGDVINFFRSILRGAFADRLDDIRSSGVHAYYIALIFEQAGIGANRKRLIGSFLDGFLRMIRRGGNLDAIRPADAVASFSKGNPHERAIDPLVPVLTEISEAVLGFARFLRDRPDRLELAELGWNELSSLWRRASGIDPDSLTPSAQDLLHEVVRGLARTITRDDAFRCVREGRFRLTVPGDPNAISTALSSMEYPIGPATIADALGSRGVVLLDDPNFPPEVLAGLAGKGWQETEEGLVFRVESEPFAETSPDGRIISAVPVWRGESADDVSLAGQYWGAHFPTQVAATTRSRKSSRLWIKSTLRVYEGRLRLYVNWFSASADLESDEATLTLGSRVVWTGQLIEGRPSHFTSLKLNLEPSDLEGTKVGLCLRTPNAAPVCTSLHVAFLDAAAFLVCEGQIVPSLIEFPILARGDGALEELILYRTEATAASATGASVVEEFPCELAGWRFVAVRLRAATDGGGAIQIVAGLTEWNLAVHRRIYFRADGAERVQFGDVTVIGSAAILPALQAHLPSLILEESSGWPDDEPPANLVLHIRAGRNTKMPLGPSHFQRLDGTWKVELGSALDGHLSQIAHGPVEVGLGIWERAPDQWITLFVFPEPPLVLPCRLGSRSTVVPVKGTEWPDVSTDWTVDRLSLNSRRIASGTMSCGAASLAFQWVPVVEDLLIGNQDNWEGKERSISLNAAGEQPLTAHAFGASGSEWTLDIAGEMLMVPSGTIRDISEAVLQALARSGQQQIDIAARLSGAAHAPIAWHIDATPTVSNFAFQWSETSTSAIAVLTCEVSVLSAAPVAAVVEFLAAGRVAVSRAVAFGLSAGSPDAAVVSGDIVLRPVDGDAVGSVVVRGWSKELLFFSREVPAPPTASAAPTDREASRRTVAQLLRTYCEQRSDSIGETLLLQVLLHVGSYRELPISGTTIRQRLQIGSEQTPTDGILSYCIALIQSILAQNAVPAVGCDSSQCTPVLRALACSLKVFHCHVMSQRGLLAPTRLAEPLAAIAQLVNVVASDRWKNWCRAVLQFGEQRVSGDAQTAAGVTDESIRGTVQQDPMAGLYQPFAAWLKTG